MPTSPDDILIVQPMPSVNFASSQKQDFILISDNTTRNDHHTFTIPLGNGLADRPRFLGKTLHKSVDYCRITSQTRSYPNCTQLTLRENKQLLVQKALQ